MVNPNPFAGDPGLHQFQLHPEEPRWDIGRLPDTYQANLHIKASHPHPGGQDGQAPDTEPGQCSMWSPLATCQPHWRGQVQPKSQYTVHST